MRLLLLNLYILISTSSYIKAQTYNTTNQCSAISADLTTHIQGTPPTGTIVSWHSGIPTTAANKIIDPTSVGNGTYYAVFHDTLNNCYAGDGYTVLTVNVTINPSPILNIIDPTICSPKTIDLTAPEITIGSNLQNGILSYWADSNATIPLTSPNAINASGIYYIKVTTLQGCYDIKPVAATIHYIKPLKIVHGPWVNN